jgi:biotin carboxyl carrier protein
MRRLKVKVGEQWHTVDVERLDVNPVPVTVDGEAMLVDVKALTGGVVPEAAVIHEGGMAPPAGDGDAIRAPMPGAVLRLNVCQGDQVSQNQVLCVLESMKMEVNLQAPRDGVVKTIHVKQGESVIIGQTILELG